MMTHINHDNLSAAQQQCHRAAARFSRNAALRRGLTRAKLATIVAMKASPKLAKRSFSYDTALETLGARPSFRGKAMVKMHALPRRLRT